MNQQTKRLNQIQQPDSTVDYAEMLCADDPPQNEDQEVEDVEDDSGEVPLGDEKHPDVLEA